MIHSFIKLRSINSRISYSLFKIMVQYKFLCK